MQTKIEKKAFCFSDSCIWIGCFKLSLLRREYLSAAIKVLWNSYKVLHITKRDIFGVIYVETDD